MSSLEDFLSTKSLHYKEIDYSRMPRIYKRIKTQFVNSKIIHIIGTNGKGTSGRFLSSALFNLGYRVGHYTSPHILNFNERIWIDGEDISNNTLDIAHQKLYKILTNKELNEISYFEYATFLAMFCFKSCEYIILEAGLGGEYDATTVFDKTLTLVTPIDIDHQDFLGKTIQKIALTKLNAIQNSAIISNQTNKEVYLVANSIASKKNINIQKIDTVLDNIDYKNADIISKNLSLVEYLKDNLLLSISALNFLKINYRTDSFYNSKLFGRFSYIKDNIILDVGHNFQAAESILNILKKKKIILVYNSLKDKNCKAILGILKPIIYRVEIIEIKDSRIMPIEKLQNILGELNINYKLFKKIDKKEKYLVFGSFLVAEIFLREYNE